MIRLRMAFLAVVVGGIVSGAFVLRVSAQQMTKPLTIDFIVPDGTPITLPIGDDSDDVIIFVGRSQGTTAIQTCASDGAQHQVQTAVIVDPGDGRATRQSSVIPASTTDAVHAGTRLANLQSLGNCIGGGFTYNKYRGEVQ